MTGTPSLAILLLSRRTLAQPPGTAEPIGSSSALCRTSVCLANAFTRRV